MREPNSVFIDFESMSILAQVVLRDGRCLICTASPAKACADVMSEYEAQSMYPRIWLLRCLVQQVERTPSGFPVSTVHATKEVATDGSVYQVAERARQTVLEWQRKVEIGGKS